MDDPDSSSEPEFVEGLKQRLLQDMVARMEGTLNRESAEDMAMFDELFDELLQEEPVVLSRAERVRLREELLASF